MAQLTQPLKWHGGKHYLAKWIIEHFPEHTHYVEPFFGGGSVLLQKPAEWVEGHSEVVNDLNGELVCFWQVLQDDSLYKEFEKLVDVIPFSGEAFDNAAKHLKTLDPANYSLNLGPYETVIRAAAFFVRNRQSRQGLMKDFATMSRTRTRRGMNEQVSSWLTAIEGLPEIHERLKRVVIFNKDAIELIKQQDGPKTLFYCDPPYLHETRVTTNDYQYEMDEADHCDLLECLSHIEGKFILSGYKSGVYDEWERANLEWRRVEKQIDNKASGKKSKDTKTECLWMNF